MKSYYQLKGGKKGAFTLRENTYRRMWYLIADYPYFKAVQSGQVKLERFKEERYSEPEAIAVSKNNFNEYIEAIEEATKGIPDIYVENVLEHIINKREYLDMDYVHENTMKKWVQRFIWLVAKNLGEI